MTEESDYRARTHTRKRVPIEERTVFNGLTLISLNLPISLLKQIDAYCEKGNYLNRSEFIRQAIRELMNRELLTEERKLELEEYYDTINNPKTEVSKGAEKKD